MKRRDVYEHFTGDKYIFHCIALPMDDLFNQTNKLVEFEKARHHSGDQVLNLYTCSSGAAFIDGEYPLVIYQRKKEVDNSGGLLLAMELSDFFGVVYNGDISIKRFSLQF